MTLGSHSGGSAKGTPRTRCSRPSDCCVAEAFAAECHASHAGRAPDWHARSAPAPALVARDAALAARRRADGRHAVLGITNVDLFIPILTFVFGEAQLEGQAAVVSYARLVDPDDRAVTTRRLAREAVHELGHTFGLVHCGRDAAGDRADAGPCVMSRSASVRAVDAKSTRLCPDCRSRHRALQQDGLHVYRQHEDSHRRR